MVGVDLAREERLQKVDLILQDFTALLENDRFKKLASKKGQVSELSKALYKDIN